MLAGAVLAALDEILRGAGERVVGLAERRHAAVAVIVEPDVEPDFRHPLGVAHGAGPGAAHFLGRAPAAIDDDEGVEQLLLPIGAAARLAPGERGERRDDRAHVVLLDVRVAEGRFDAPQPEHHRAFDPVVLLDAGEQRRVFLRLLLAGDDAPVGDAAVEILPELLVEFGLRAVELKYRRVRLDVAHHPRVGGVGNATRARSGAKTLDPLLELAPLCPRPRARGRDRRRQHRRERPPRQEKARPFGHNVASRNRSVLPAAILQPFLSALRPELPALLPPRALGGPTGPGAWRGGRRWERRP